MTSMGIRHLAHSCSFSSYWLNCVLSLLAPLNKIYRCLLNWDSLTSWRLRFLFGWVSLLFCVCSVFCLFFFLSTTLLNLSVSCRVLILFWSPTQVARSKVYSEGILSSIYSCKYIDQLCPSASLDTKTTFLLLRNISQHINNTQESRYAPCNSVLDLMKVIKQQILGKKVFQSQCTDILQCNIRSCTTVSLGRNMKWGLTLASRWSHCFFSWSYIAGPNELLCVHHVYLYTGFRLFYVLWIMFVVCWCISRATDMGWEHYLPLKQNNHWKTDLGLQVLTLGI